MYDFFFFFLDLNSVLLVICGVFLLNSYDTSPTSVNLLIACKEKCFSINLARIPTLKIQNELYL